MKKGSSLVLILLLCFVWGAFLRIEVVKADSKTIVVPDDYSTIQEAVDATNEGDSVFVTSGTYN